jgi:hypothetical protein
MTDKVILVTPPDDVQQDGLRLLLVNLTPDLSQVVSDALAQIDKTGTVISYIWKMGDSVTWLLDKKHKSDIILFNANVQPDGATELIIGYIAAQPKSYYFGNLKNLAEANTNAIYNVEDLNLIITTGINRKANGN